MTTTTTLYFASTSLDLRRTEKPDGYPQDIFIEDVCYRKIDPLYFAWLRSRMGAAQRAFDSGRLPQNRWDELRGRFNRLQEWAIGHYGKEALQSAIREFDPANYAQPVNRQPEPFLFPKTGDWRFTEPVAPHAVAKVNAIRKSAEGRGWPPERLYQNRGPFVFPLGGQYGLVCFIGPNDELGEIAEVYIEIIHHNPNGKRIVRFYRHRCRKAFDRCTKIVQ